MNKEALMNQRKRYFIIIAFLLIVTCFCAGTQNKLYALSSSSDINKISYVAGDMLESNLLCSLNKTLPILSTTFVNFDNLKETSTLGRLLGDQIASRFSQHGYKVIEIKLRNGKVLVQEGNGEFILSRDMKKLNKSYDAQAIIIGTYSFVGNRVFLSTKLVSTSDSSILSSYFFSLQENDYLKMLAQSDVQVEESHTELAPEVAENKILKESLLLKLSDPLSAKIIQSQLLRLGFYTSKIDGKWGKYSRAALVAFRRAYKLTPGDKWNFETQLALFGAVH